MSAIPPEPALAYLKLRKRILSFSPEEIGLSPSEAAPHVWGVVMEMNYKLGSATLAVLADGTTSLYYSTGGGLLGRGDYAPLAEASKALIALAESFLQHMSITKEFPLPETGQVRFILLTFTGTYAADAPAILLSSNKHLLSPLFIHAQEILSQLRILAEKRSK